MLKLLPKSLHNVYFQNNIYLLALRKYAPGLGKLNNNVRSYNDIPQSNGQDQSKNNKLIRDEMESSENPYKVTKRMWEPSPRLENGQSLDQYKKLSKFRLTTLVVITTMAGYAVAPAPFDPTSFILCSLGTGLVSAAANSVNQFHEVPFDSQMSRTKSRVIVTGKVTPLHAMGFALLSSVAGLSVLYYGVNCVTATLGLGNLVLYTSIYTPMKRMTILNTWVGSAVGAIPPLIGWAGCCGSLDAGAWILAGLLYAWQFPHFNALSWNLRPDYSRAGYQMMAVSNPGLCRRTALRYTFVIMLLSGLAPIMDVTNYWFALETLPINGYFVYLAYTFYKDSNSGTSRKLFRFSLLHLPVLMFLFLINKKKWVFSENKEDDAKIYTCKEKKLDNDFEFNLLDRFFNASPLEVPPKPL